MDYYLFLLSTEDTWEFGLYVLVITLIFIKVAKYQRSTENLCCIETDTHISRGYIFFKIKRNGCQT